MDASLSAVGLRKLSRSLACLARFGETVTLLALPHELVLTTLSPAKSAHAKVAFGADFFVEWSLLSRVPRRGVTCDLNIKALLGVLRIRAGEKLEACELSLRDEEQMVSAGAGGGRSRRPPQHKRRRTEGASSGDDEGDRDDGEEGEEERPDGQKVEQPRFSVRLSFPGFVKHHALQIATPPGHGVPNHQALESTFTASARDVGEWMEAFPAWGSGAAASGIGGGGAGGGLGSGSSAKEEFLAWAFDKDGVRISTWAATARQDQLATAFFVPADAFESFYLSPTFSASAERDHVLGFPMREFKAVTLLAQSLNLPIRVNFKQPYQPLALSLPSASGPDDDLLAFEFLIMTRDVPASAAAAGNGGGGRRSEAAAAAPKVERSNSQGARASGCRGDVDGPRASSSAGRLTQGARRLRLGPSVEPSGSEPSVNGGGRVGTTHSQRDVSDVELPPVHKKGFDDGDDDQGGNMDYHFESSATRRQHDPTSADITFSHPLAHSTARLHQPATGTLAEPLFYPGPASQQPLSQQTQNRPFASQLTQAELEDLGLGGLDGLDFDMADDDGDGFGGGGAGKPRVLDRPETEPVVPTQTDDQAEGTQIAPTQVEGVGRAFIRFEGGESDEDLDEANVVGAAASEMDDGLVNLVGADEEETYEMSASV